MKSFVWALAAGAVLAAGCASKEEPARNAVQAAEASLNEVRADGEKYAPEQLRTADARLAAMKQDLAGKKYNDVLRESLTFRNEVSAVEDQAIARQTAEAAAGREWDDLNEDVPKLVDAIQQRVDSLKGRKLPKEVDKASFETAVASFEQMKSQWQEAIAAASAGNKTEAADKGRAVQAKAKEVTQKLAMSPV